MSLMLLGQGCNQMNIRVERDTYRAGRTARSRPYRSHCSRQHWYKSKELLLALFYTPVRAVSLLNNRGFPTESISLLVVSPVSYHFLIGSLHTRDDCRSLQVRWSM